MGTLLRKGRQTILHKVAQEKKFLLNLIQSMKKHKCRKILVVSTSTRPRRQKIETLECGDLNVVH